MRLAGLLPEQRDKTSLMFDWLEGAYWGLEWVIERLGRGRWGGG